MKLLIDSSDEYFTYRKLAAQGKTDSEIHDILYNSNLCADVEIMIHADLPTEDETEHLVTWSEKPPEEPFELSTPLCNFSSLEKDLLPAFRGFLKSENLAFVVRTPDPAGDIMNFCKAPPISKEFTDKQNALASFMSQHNITEIRPTEEGLKIWHENGMIENITFHTNENLNYPHYKEEEGATA